MKKLRAVLDINVVVFVVLFIFCLVGVYLAGSAERDPVKEGRVVGKSCRNAHIAFWSGNIYPPEYYLRIAGCNEEGRDVVCCVTCTPEEYKKYEVGDCYEQN